MLLNSMAESKSHIIPLPTIVFSTLLMVLRFLSAGDSFWKDDVGEISIASCTQTLVYDWNSMLELLVASCFFSLDRLENLVVRRLWLDLPSENDLHLEATLNKLAISLSTLCSYSTLFTDLKGKKAKLVEAVRFRMQQILISHDMKEITAFKNFQRILPVPPSEDTNHSD
ncbi:hypothetical protein R1flu_001773 [Riccia fluitans]|uniref:Uncharacterized protein n=1 Tax=Riccia fluitans TaxID=41844 RepID=A0ABD1Y476_9MARC